MRYFSILAALSGIVQRNRPPFRCAFAGPLFEIRWKADTILDCLLKECIEYSATKEKGEIMSAERARSVTLRGNPVSLVGPEIKVGQDAPDFTAVDNGLQL